MDWNPRERLSHVTLLFYPRFGLVWYFGLSLELWTNFAPKITFGAPRSFIPKVGWFFISAIKKVNSPWLDDLQLFPAFGFSGEIPTNLNLDRCLEFVKPWLVECSKNHPACKPPLPSKSELPIRILDIKSLKSGLFDFAESSRI